jgi:hypothetical protein
MPLESLGYLSTSGDCLERTIQKLLERYFLILIDQSNQFENKNYCFDNSCMN